MFKQTVVFNSVLLYLIFPGMPPGGSVEAMKRVWQNSTGMSPKPMTVLSALFRTSEEVEKMDLRLKVSREEKNLGLFLVKHRHDLHKCPDEPDSLKPFTDFIIDVSGISAFPDLGVLCSFSSIHIFCQVFAISKQYHNH